LAKYINKLRIDSYRGITGLNLNEFGDINILLGDNNCGKTSLLEVIQILSRPVDFNNIVMVARQRDRHKMIPFFYPNYYDSFLNIFNKSNEIMQISFGLTDCNGTTSNVMLNGGVLKSLLTNSDFDSLKQTSRRQRAELSIDTEIDTFTGILTNKNDINLNVSLNKYSRISKSLISKDRLFNIEFLSTIDHIITDKMRSIIKSKELTIKVVNLLKKCFDNDILDLKTLPAEDERGYQVVIDHATLGYLPLSLYGDGIKKVIAIAGAVSIINNGVLLIDEYETSIHTNAMKTVFRFITDICKEKNLQFFLTTHSIEAVDKFLDCEDSFLNNIRIITLKKNSKNMTVARVLNGKEAKENRELYEMELRI
jgi:AAA15 family ATPase/GTPase